MTSPSTNLPTTSPLEGLPSELIRKILLWVSQDSKPEISSWSSLAILEDPSINSPPLPYNTILDLISCLLTSKTLYTTTIPVLYRHIKISQPKNFSKFFAQLQHAPILGRNVRSLDFSDLSPRDQESTSLYECLTLTPLLREFRIGYGVENLLDETVLGKLFCGLLLIERIDLSGCNSTAFIERFSSLLSDPEVEISRSIMELKLHDYRDLPSVVFETLISQLPNLRALDVANTMITMKALEHIPETARLTYMNLSHCQLLDRKALAHFTSSHLSVKNSLIYLNIDMSPRIENQVLDPDDVAEILSNAPSSLRYLNLKNVNMTETHILYLRGLAGQLVELSMGSNLRLKDVEGIYLPLQEGVDGEDENIEEEITIESKYETVLSPMGDAVAICKLRQRLNSVSSNVTSNGTKLAIRYLDISSLPINEQGKIRTSILLGKQSLPLETIEVSECLFQREKILPRLCGSVGWELKSKGGRCFICKKRQVNERREWI